MRKDWLEKIGSHLIAGLLLGAAGCTHPDNRPPEPPTMPEPNISSDVSIGLEGDRVDMSLADFKAIHPTARIWDYEGVTNAVIGKAAFGIEKCDINYEFIDDKLADINLMLPQEDRPRILKELEALYGHSAHVDGISGFADIWTDGRRVISFSNGGVLSFYDQPLIKKRLKKAKEDEDKKYPVSPAGKSAN